MKWKTLATKGKNKASRIAFPFRKRDTVNKPENWQEGVVVRPLCVCN
jgi:hypothetical protein